MGDGLFPDAALKYAGIGLAVFPLNGKLPAMKGGYLIATTNSEKIRSWWDGQFAGYNIGVATGSASGVIVLDIDNKASQCGANGFASLETLIAEYGDLPASAIQWTGFGEHHFFRPGSQTVRNSVGRIAPGIDVRGEGGYVVVAPSVHPDTGQPYSWKSERPPLPSEIVEAPAWLLRLATKRVQANSVQLSDHGRVVSSRYGQVALLEECSNIEQAKSGLQEITLNNASYSIGTLVGAGCLNYLEAYDALVSVALKMPSFNPQDPWRPEILAAKIAKAMADGKRHPRTRVSVELGDTAQGRAP
jgi:hypothetical protein